MELWDVYDSNRLKTGKLHERGIPMSQGDYHIVVHVWVKNADGKFLITKRSPNKEFALHWECTGGSAHAGDSSLDAALREVFEETGLRLDRHKGKIVYTFKNDAGYMFHDVWLFAHDFALSEIVLQEGETCDAMLATAEEIRVLIDQGAFVPVEEYIENVLGRTDE